MPELYRLEKCVVCGVEKRGPWPSCGKKACVIAHRRDRMADTWRSRRQRWEEEGACKGCGCEISAKRKKAGFKTCAACAVQAAVRSANRRERQAKAKIKQAATKRVLDKRAEKVAIQHERLERGFGISRSTHPQIPKNKKVLARYGKRPDEDVLTEG